MLLRLAGSAQTPQPDRRQKLSHSTIQREASEFAIMKSTGMGHAGGMPVCLDWLLRSGKHRTHCHHTHGREAGKRTAQFDQEILLI